MPVDADILGTSAPAASGEGFTPPSDPLAGSPAPTGEPASEPTSAPTPTPAPAPTEPAPTDGTIPTSVREALASRGYDTSGFQSEADALDGLLATAEEFHRTRPYVQVGQRYSPHADAIDAYLEERARSTAGQSAPAVPGQPAAPGQSVSPVAEPAGKQEPSGLKWEPPEYDPAWETRARWDADNQRYAPASQYDSPVVAEKLNAFRDWQVRTSRDLLTRFPELVEEAMGGRLKSLEESMESRVQGIVREAITGYDSQQQSSQFFSDREKELFEVDAQGQRLADPATGEPVLSAKGRAFREYAEQGQAFGITDQNNLLRYVDEQLRRDDASGRFGQPGGQPSNGNGSQQAPEPTPGQVAEHRKGEFLRRVVRGQHLPQRSGSFPAPNASDSTQNPDETLDEIFEDELRKKGLSPQTG